MKSKKENSTVYIYPTDTVWGIGGSIFSETAYEKIAQVKQTKLDKPLSIMFPNLEMIYEYFNLPSFMNKDWMREFFKLESSLGIEAKLLKINLPEWLTKKSNFISIRCIENSVTSSIYQKIETPFFTTSLNITKEPPITKFVEAKKFYEIHAKDCEFLYENDLNLSGESSTIVFYENDEFKIIRPGRLLNSIKVHIKKLNKKIS